MCIHAGSILPEAYNHILGSMRYTVIRQGLPGSLCARAAARLPTAAAAVRMDLGSVARQMLSASRRPLMPEGRSPRCTWIHAGMASELTPSNSIVQTPHVHPSSHPEHCCLVEMREPSFK